MRRRTRTRRRIRMKTNIRAAHEATHQGQDVEEEEGMPSRCNPLTHLWQRDATRRHALTSSIIFILFATS